MLFETIETHKNAKDIMCIDKSGDENPGRLKIPAFLRAHSRLLTHRILTH